MSLGLMFNDSWVLTISGRLMSASLPSNYKIHNSDWADSYIQINPQNRAIYAKKDGRFVNLVNHEFGPTRPYVVYHANNATATRPAVTAWYSSKYYPDVTPANSCDLLYIANTIYNTGANPLSFRISNSVKIQWK